MREKNLSKIETQFLGVLAAVVAMVGVPVFFSFNPESSKITQTLKIADAMTSRNPSSLASPAPVSDRSAVIVRLPCGRELPLQKVNSNYVRLNGKACAGVNSVEITNTSNGFSASIFLGKDKTFSTDFIDLKEGDNELKIRELTSGHEESFKTFHIQRRSPASNPERTQF